MFFRIVLGGKNKNNQVTKNGEERFEVKLIKLNSNETNCCMTDKNDLFITWNYLFFKNRKVL